MCNESKEQYSALNIMLAVHTVLANRGGNNQYLHLLTVGRA
jgi:hypothetical protein